MILQFLIALERLLKKLLHSLNCKRQKYREISDQALATVLEETRDFVILTDEILHEVYYANSTAQKVLGIIDLVASVAQTPRSLRDVYTPETFETLLKSIQEHLGQDRVWRGEALLHGVSGEIIPVSQQIHLHDDPSTGLKFVSLVISGYRYAQKTQETLQKQEEFYRLITENTSDLISLFDSNGDNIYSSPSYHRLLGFSSSDLEIQGFYNYIHEDDRERVRNIVRSTIQSGKEVILRYRMMNKSETILHFEATTGGIRKDKGHFQRLILVSRDITAQEQQREERRLVQLHHLHAQKMESIGQLAAGVAHEMNTPIQYFGDNLRFIRDSFSDLSLILKSYYNYFQNNLDEGYDHPKQNQFEQMWKEFDTEFLLKEIPKSIDQSLKGVSNLAHIVGAMKEFSHPGTDNKIPLDINSAIENTLTIARNEWKYIADISLDLDYKLPLVNCLPDEILQMLLNLVINACHAIEEKGLVSGQKGSINIATKEIELQGQKFVELRLSDSGVGIPAEARNRIFEPFFTTKPVGKGTGQGLAIVHNVVIDKHSGQLHVESKENEGTTFVVCLPTDNLPNLKSK